MKAEWGVRREGEEERVNVCERERKGEAGKEGCRGLSGHANTSAQPWEAMPLTSVPRMCRSNP